MNVGVLGLGIMGSSIVNRLAMKGHKITVFNRDRSKAEKTVAAGTRKLTVADSPKEVGDSSDVAIICVKAFSTVFAITEFEPVLHSAAPYAEYCDDIAHMSTTIPKSVVSGNTGLIVSFYPSAPK
jgi:3-hydroxyisobutyrate dehydrogenase-like beta-hydroxyacid dehydrogenase